MKKLINIDSTRILNKHELKSINGGITCFECYDNCVATSKARMELGICFNGCQLFCSSTPLGEFKTINTHILIKSVN